LRCKQLTTDRYGSAAAYTFTLYAWTVDKLDLDPNTVSGAFVGHNINGNVIAKATVVHTFPDVSVRGGTIPSSPPRLVWARGHDRPLVAHGEDARALHLPVSGRRVRFATLRAGVSCWRITTLRGGPGNSVNC
jgi:hypothetical protein